jgi:hypothetical protein
MPRETSPNGSTDVTDQSLVRLGKLSRTGLESRGRQEGYSPGDSVKPSVPPQGADAPLSPPDGVEQVLTQTVAKPIRRVRELLESRGVPQHDIAVVERAVAGQLAAAEQQHELNRIAGERLRKDS